MSPEDHLDVKWREREDDKSGNETHKVILCSVAAVVIQEGRKRARGKIGVVWVVITAGGNAHETPLHTLLKRQALNKTYDQIKKNLSLRDFEKKKKIGNITVIKERWRKEINIIKKRIQWTLERFSSQDPFLFLPFFRSDWQNGIL